MARRQHALSVIQDPCAAKAILTFALLAAPACGADMEIALRYGESGDYERSGVSLRLAPLWSADWGGWKAALRPEFELSHFRYDGPASGPDSLEQGGVIAHFRASHGTGALRPYAEAGLGFSLLSNDTLGSKAFSTHYQFSEHLGLGVGLAENWFAGYQYSHYSNAGIEEPNDGIDMHQLVVGAHF
jgi:hypothetical protein